MGGGGTTTAGSGARGRTPGALPRQVTGPAALITAELAARIKREREKKKGQFAELLRPRRAREACAALQRFCNSRGVSAISEIHGRLVMERVQALL